MADEQDFSKVPVYTGEVVENENVAGFPVPSAPMLQTKTQYHTAVTVQKSRNLDKVVAAVMREAELAGEAFYWSWPVKNKKTGKQEIIDGPSVGLALAVAREWTNVAVPVDYCDTPTEWIFTAHFVDLEKGFTVSRVYRKRKGKSENLGAWGDRNEDMNFQAAQSRAIRNVIVAGVPRWLLDQAKEKAKEAVLKKITPEKLAFAREQSLKVFAKYGIDETRIVAVLGVPVAQWASEEIISLKGFLSQIKDGQTTAEQIFPPIEEKEKPEPEKKRGRSTKSQDAPPVDPKPEAQSQSAPTTTATTGGQEGIPRGINPHQLEDLEKVPLDILEAGYRALKIDSKLPLNELTEGIAADLQVWLREQ